MEWVYFDASALVKRYAREPGSGLVNALFRLVPRTRITCCTLAIPEVVSALHRKRNNGRLSRARRGRP